MKIAKAKLKSISVYQQGRFHQTEKHEKELADDYEKRTWQERCHVTEDGYIFMPPMQFKKCIETAASFLSMGIKGKGKATYTKHFRAGILVTEGLITDTKKEGIKGEWILGNSMGRRGASGARVMKCFPTIPAWEGIVSFYILDDIISEDVFEVHLKEAGNFIGVGVFRPENGGYHGRFTVENIEWEYPTL